MKAEKPIRRAVYESVFHVPVHFCHLLSITSDLWVGDLTYISHKRERILSLTNLSKRTEPYKLNINLKKLQIN